MPVQSIFKLYSIRFPRWQNQITLTPCIFNQRPQIQTLIVPTFHTNSADLTDLYSLSCSSLLSRQRGCQQDGHRMQNMPLVRYVKWKPRVLQASPVCIDGLVWVPGWVGGHSPLLTDSPFISAPYKRRTVAAEPRTLANRGHCENHLLLNERDKPQEAPLWLLGFGKPQGLCVDAAGWNTFDMWRGSPPTQCLPLR